jgi:hypothetical protein
MRSPANGKTLGDDRAFEQRLQHGCDVGGN